MQQSDDGVQAMLSVAAAPILAALDRLVARTNPRSAGMFQYIRNHLFDPDLTLKRLRRDCKLTDWAVNRFAWSEVNRPPFDFIVRCRLAVAETLLLTTRCTNRQLMTLCGFNTPIVLYKTFRRFHGMPPGAFRRRYSTGRIEPVTQFTGEGVTF